MKIITKGLPKGVDIAGHGRGGKKYPFERIQPGQTMEVPVYEGDVVEGARVRVSNACRNWRARSGNDFPYRTWTGEVEDSHKETYGVGLIGMVYITRIASDSEFKTSILEEK